MSEPINGDKLWSQVQAISERLGLGRPIHVPDLEDRLTKALGTNSLNAPNLGQNVTAAFDDWAQTLAREGFLPPSRLEQMAFAAGFAAGRGERTA